MQRAFGLPMPILPGRHHFFFFYLQHGSALRTGSINRCNNILPLNKFSFVGKANAMATKQNFFSLRSDITIFAQTDIDIFKDI